MSVYAYLALFDCSCLACAAAMVITGHPWWAVVFILLTMVNTVTTRETKTP